MTAPQLTFQMIKHIDFSHPDPHAVTKALNQVIEEKYLSDQGKCPHRPSTLVVQMSGDMAHKASGSYCIYCAQEIEIERIVWRLKNVLPSAPVSR